MKTNPIAAADQARRLVAAAPRDEAAIRLLASAIAAAVEAEPPRSEQPPAGSPDIEEARAKLEAGDQEAAELLVRARLKSAPRDYEAMNLLADIAARCGFLDNAILILRRATVFCPTHAESWAHLGRLLHRQNKFDEALDALDESLRLRPADEATLSYKAAMLVQMRRLDEAAATFEALVAAHPHRARGWMNYAFVLKTQGATGQAVAAYRTATALEPTSGPAWWGYANMKVARFLPEDLTAMRRATDIPDMRDADRCDLHFAYASSLDQFRRYPEAAEQLRLGNALRKKMHPYEQGTVRGDVDRSINVFTRAFFAPRHGWGSTRRDPIFILGMPRSGSTLVEQILASHSLVEGTEELFSVQQIHSDLARAAGKEDGYPANLEEMPRAAVERLAERYLAETSRYRQGGRPFFTDKMPGNWLHIGLIHLMLPNARIVDVRRDPRDCCFANYAQHFQWGMNATYSQADIADYYREYVRLTQHFDEVLPRLVHRIIYEEMVDDFERHVRALLEYLELPFEEACLRFFETDRPVHTPSAQQVRQPINRNGIGRWKAYEAYLGEMLDALGDLPETYARP